MCYPVSLAPVPHIPSLVHPPKGGKPAPAVPVVVHVGEGSWGGAPGGTPSALNSSHVDAAGLEELSGDWVRPCMWPSLSFTPISHSILVTMFCPVRVWCNNRLH